MGEEPAKEGKVSDELREQEGTVIVVGSPAVVSEEFEEGNLLVRRCLEYVFWCAGLDRHTGRKEVASDIHISSAKGEGESSVKKGGGEGFGGDDGLNCGKGAVWTAACRVEGSVELGLLVKTVEVVQKVMITYYSHGFR